MRYSPSVVSREKGVHTNEGPKTIARHSIQTLFCIVVASRIRTKEARKRQVVRDETHKWHARCKEQEHRTLKWKVRVLKETEFFNGRVITGQYQRYNGNRLRLT